MNINNISFTLFSKATYFVRNYNLLKCPPVFYNTGNNVDFGLITYGLSFILKFWCKIYYIIIWRKVVFDVIGLVSRNTKGCTTRSEKTEVYMKALVDMVAIAAQATGFVVWPFLEARQRPNLWLIPVSLFCISCGWWENYVAKNSVISESHSQIKP